ncbi:hypothetical protein GJ699_06910 [Duganella sp. FT80W]|uniref:Uncharacterized protein n=1 Tax=Duganella guangzhouensis TaxID=2666084 RepID=A0A6I2KUX9_9BURK|nr:hypothetical protein [Duganella guangzhouensis]MRW89708.1 hypothetical protein [Duganella guangzhouensis]
MKHFSQLHRLKTLGMLAICLGMPVGAFAAEPVLAAKPVVRSYTLVGYNRNIKQSDFDGLGKATVLQLQQQLKDIYKQLPDWQSDYAMKEQPLNDGIVGRITLSWLQRYGFNFKIVTDAGYAQALPAHVARVAAFGSAHPTELGVLLGPEFEDWDEEQPAAVKAKDYGARQRAAEAELLELVNRFRASRVTAPRPTDTSTDSNGYFSYVLRKDDLELLQGKDQLAQKLMTLKDKHFRSQEEMKVGLLHTLGNREELLKSLWPVVKSNTRGFYGFLINSTTLDKLEKSNTLEPATMDQLRELGTVYLPSQDAYDSYIADRTNDGTLKITEEEIALLAKGTRVFDNFHLDEQSLDTIHNQLKDNVLNAGMPAQVVRMLEQMQDVSYAELSIFRSAAISKIDFGIGMCKLNAPTNNPYVSNLRISDDDTAALEKQLQVLHPHSVDGTNHLVKGWDDAFQQINALRAKAELCDDATDKQSKELVANIYLTYLGVAIENLARKRMPDTIPTIQIKGGKCGCALDDLPRITYGFYPYWEKKEQVQSINFRALNRVAFQALAVDNVGNFMLGADNFDVTDVGSAETAFVRVAHQYNSKVDWVIQKNDWDGDWKSFSAQSRKAVFAKIRANIMALLTTPMSDTVSKLKGYSTLGLEQPRRGDGVTLYFPNYPDDAEATSEFNTFFLALRTQLDDEGLGLNILVAQNVLMAGRNGGPGAFGLANLITLRKKRSATEPSRPGGPENDEFILVLLNEPSSDAKKALRASIERDSALHGSDRADFLRSLLPVLHFDNRNWQQLEDDIVYARDSFGGVGLWAPDFDNLAQPVQDPSLSCLQSKQLNICLARNYSDPTEEIKLPGPLESFACVQRWTLRVILAVLLAIIFTVVVLFFRFCGAQNFIKKYFLYVLLLVAIPALLVFTMLLLYDPLLARLSSGNLPFFMMAVFCMAILIAGYIYLRQRRRVPMRQRGTLVRHDGGLPILVWRTEASEHGFEWVIRNNGSGYAIIKNVEIMFDNHPFADVKAALDSVLATDTKVQWKSMPLLGKKVDAGGELLALTIADADAAREVESRLAEGQLVVHIVYGGASSEHWITDGKEVRSISIT